MGVRQTRELALIAPVGADEVFDLALCSGIITTISEDDPYVGRVANRIDADYVATYDG
ncbi:MAG: hypothetical protein ACLU7D_04740 [Collinsella sp.]